VKIVYLHDVTEPKWQAGRKGEAKDVPEHTAYTLIDRGYARPKNLLFKKTAGKCKPKNLSD